MRLPNVHTSVLFPSRNLQVSCLLLFTLMCTPADAHDQPPLISAHHFGGVIRLPVSHKSFSDVHHSYQEPRRIRHGHGRRTLADPTLQSKLITLNASRDLFFATLQIGTPAQKIAVILDTGSELLWIQCLPCSKCSPQAPGFPIFNPAESSSFQSFMCSAPICSVVADASVTTGCSSDSNACTYFVRYGDGSNSSGILAQEPLTFATTEASSVAWTTPPLVLGCGKDTEGSLAHFNASGLMGLDRGAYSIISQLSIDVFSYCLPDRTSTVDVTGYLTLGSVGNSSTSSSNIPLLQYTPMIQNNFSLFSSQLYFVTVTGISVNGLVLDIPPTAFEINGTGAGGTFLDSGTTFTRFVDEVFTVFIQAFENAMTATPTILEGNVCYGVPLSEQGGAPSAPTVTIHFDGSLDMDLGTDQLLFPASADTTNIYYCLAFTNAGSLDSGVGNVIGNYQQQNFLIEFDIGNSRIGMAPTQCSQP